jgi:hypothetical protein
MIIVVSTLEPSTRIRVLQVRARSFYAVVTSEPLQCSATCPCVITVDIGGRGEMLRRALRADWCRLHRER